MPSTRFPCCLATSYTRVTNLSTFDGFLLGIHFFPLRNSNAKFLRGRRRVFLARRICPLCMDCHQTAWSRGMIDAQAFLRCVGVIHAALGEEFKIHTSPMKRRGVFLDIKVVHAVPGRTSWNFCGKIHRIDSYAAAFGDTTTSTRSIRTP